MRSPRRGARTVQEIDPQRSPHRLVSLLATPVDGASLAAFRICFGLVMCWHVAKYLRPLPQGGNLARFLYVLTPWNFPYPGFEWVRPWPEPLLTAHFVLVGLAALCLAIGLYYRTAAVALFVSYTYVFLLEQANYNNHYYLICLVAFLLIWMPAQTRFSVDAWLRRRRGGAQVAPDTAAGHQSIPFWPVFLLRAQLFILYFYGGLAKLNDDWLRGLPLIAPGNELHEFLGHLGLPRLVTVHQVCLFLAWGGLVFDLSIGFLLMMRRTRWLAVLLLAIFHGTNQCLFPIGVFPTLAFTATLIFFNPDWPLRFGRWLRQPRVARPDWRWFVGGGMVLPLVGAALGWRSAATNVQAASPRPLGRLVLTFVGVWIAVQLLVPFRHFAIAGDANWTEEGHYFAWRMMLRAKAAGHLVYYLHDRGLQGAGDRGQITFAWDLWSDKHAIYVPVDYQCFRLDNRFGLNVMHEPCLGQRMLFTPRGVTDQAVGQARAEIGETWRTKVGREARIQETISLEQALREVRAQLEALTADEIAGHTQVYEDCLEHLTAVSDLAGHGSEGDEQERESRWVEVADRLSIIARSPLGDVVVPILRRIHPLALQGTASPQQRVLLVEDAQASGEACDQALRHLCEGNPYLVWVDLSRLSASDWGQLPRAFVTLDNKELKIVWNYFDELNHIQLESLAVRPDMIRQYAQRVASLWEAQTGRRPQVFALSNVMLNYGAPQPVVDPHADLASVSYRLWSHNAWIFPQAAQVAGRVESKVRR